LEIKLPMYDIKCQLQSYISAKNWPKLAEKASQLLALIGFGDSVRKRRSALTSFAR